MQFLLVFKLLQFFLGTKEQLEAWPIKYLGCLETP